MNKTTEINEKKRPARLESITIDIDSPFLIQFKDISINKINLFTGQNGTGKSFLLKTGFLLSCLSQSINKGTKEQLEYLFQEMTDLTFSNHNLNGLLGCKYDTGEELNVIYENGKVKDFNFANFDDYTDIVPVKYLSSEMRTFNSISHYLKDRKEFISSSGEMILNICSKNGYKLYDALYLEGLLLKMPAKINESVSLSLKDSFDFTEEFVEINVDTDKNDFFLTNKEGKKFYCKNFGNGHQSIINMNICAML